MLLEHNENTCEWCNSTTGVTVKQLKELIKDLPEVDHYGDDLTVWVGDGEGYSNIVTAVHPLNKRTDGGYAHADIILSCNGVFGEG